MNWIGNPPVRQYRREVPYCVLSSSCVVVFLKVYWKALFSAAAGLKKSANTAVQFYVEIIFSLRRNVVQVWNFDLSAGIDKNCSSIPIFARTLKLLAQITSMISVKYFCSQ